jgi:hypothetical protein
MCMGQTGKHDTWRAKDLFLLFSCAFEPVYDRVLRTLAGGGLALARKRHNM